MLIEASRDRGGPLQALESFPPSTTPSAQPLTPTSLTGTPPPPPSDSLPSISTPAEPITAKDAPGPAAPSAEPASSGPTSASQAFTATTLPLPVAPAASAVNPNKRRGTFAFRPSHSSLAERPSGEYRTPNFLRTASFARGSSPPSFNSPIMPAPMSFSNAFASSHDSGNMMNLALTPPELPTLTDDAGLDRSHARLLFLGSSGGSQQQAPMASGSTSSANAPPQDQDAELAAIRGLLGIAGDSSNSSDGSDAEGETKGSAGSSKSASGKAKKDLSASGPPTSSGRPVRSTRLPSLNMSLGSILNDGIEGLSSDEENEEDEAEDKTFIPDTFGAPAVGERKHAFNAHGRTSHPNAKRPRATSYSQDSYSYSNSSVAASYPLQLPQPLLNHGQSSDLSNASSQGLLPQQFDLNSQITQQQNPFQAQYQNQFQQPQLPGGLGVGVLPVQQEPQQQQNQQQQPQLPQQTLPQLPQQPPRARTTALPNKRRYRASTTTGNGNFKCLHVNQDGTTCPVSFRRSYDLARHKESKHGRDMKGTTKNWICEGCGGEFARKDSLQRHAINKGHNAGV